MSEIILEVMSQEDNTVRYYSLVVPDYFEGPFNWLGSGLFASSLNELAYYAEYLYSGLTDEYKEAYLATSLLLKSVTIDGDEIKFIAASISQLEEIPHDFQWLIDFTV